MSRAYLKAFDAQRGRWRLQVLRQVIAEFERERLAIKRAILEAQDPVETLTRADAAFGVRQPAWRLALTEVGTAVAMDFAPRVHRVLLGASKAATSVTRIEELSHADLARIVYGFGPAGASSDQWTRTITDYLATENARKSHLIVETTRKQALGELVRGVALNEAPATLARRIDRLFKVAILPHRGASLAQTELISASNLGSRAGALATGLTLEKIWTTMGSTAGSRHAAVSGQATPMYQPYVVCGWLLMFPGDTSHGAAASQLVNCRCIERYRRATES